MASLLCDVCPGDVGERERFKSEDSSGDEDKAGGLNSETVAAWSDSEPATPVNSSDMVPEEPPVPAPAPDEAETHGTPGAPLDVCN